MPLTKKAKSIISENIHLKVFYKMFYEYLWDVSYFHTSIHNIIMSRGESISKREQSRT